MIPIRWLEGGNKAKQMARDPRVPKPTPSHFEQTMSLLRTQDQFDDVKAKLARRRNPANEGQLRAAAKEHADPRGMPMGARVNRMHAAARHGRR
jgi:hypothetical protein